MENDIFFIWTGLAKRLLEIKGASYLKENKDYLLKIQTLFHYDVNSFHTLNLTSTVSNTTCII